ncbi:protein sidekick-1-like [Lytechinus variegatus]|uniref:protein sidekick-1-like n=1 Tax=Lytechinus variegatus TaxID=7654 RepID=UPI001BB1AC82|nr:protein sidekick-1-like [Lytechinus variegatus]
MTTRPRGSDIPDEIVPVNDGETATLRCNISTNPKQFDRLSWTKDDLTEKIALIKECKGIQISNSLCNISVSTPGKYSVAGDLASDIILRVRDVTIDDDGIYTCKAITLGGSPSKCIRLAVLRPPTDITLLDINKQLALTERDVMNVVRDRTNRINCTVPSSNPEANIKWTYGDVHVTVHEQTNRSVGSDVPFVTSTRALDIFPTADDTGGEISCVVKHYGLSTALQKNVILNVGSLPNSPKDVKVVGASVTPTSFTLAWLRGSFDGEQETYTVVYCSTHELEQCLDISGIVATRVKIDNLRPFTSYRIEVSSESIFGSSEDNAIVIQLTKPLSPTELGIKAIYNPSDMSVDVTRPHRELDPLPIGICFQLVQTPSSNSADPTLEESECVGVDESVPIPPGWTLNKLAIVTFGNTALSAPSEILGISKGKDL